MKRILLWSFMQKFCCLLMFALENKLTFVKAFEEIDIGCNKKQLATALEIKYWSINIYITFTARNQTYLMLFLLLLYHAHIFIVDLLWFLIEYYLCLFYISYFIKQRVFQPAASFEMLNNIRCSNTQSRK